MDKNKLVSIAREIRSSLKEMATEITCLSQKEIDQEGQVALEKIKENSVQIWEKISDILKNSGEDEEIVARQLFEQVAEVAHAEGAFKILLVEDDVHILELIYRALSRQYPNSNIKVAENGVDACTTLGSFLPDLVFTDLMMTEVNGVSVVRHIIENSRYKSTRVVIVTALNEWEEQVQEVRSLGVAAVVHKPFSIKALLKSIDSVLDS